MFVLDEIHLKGVKITEDIFGLETFVKLFSWTIKGSLRKDPNLLPKQSQVDLAYRAVNYPLAC